jgi:hypothetical protein
MACHAYFSSARGQVLKRADAVRVDIDGERLLKLVEKDTKRKENTDKRSDEPKKPNGPTMMAVGEAVHVPASTNGATNLKNKPQNQKEKKPASTEPKELPLSMRQLKSKLGDIMAVHLDKPDLQLLSYVLALCLSQITSPSKMALVLCIDHVCISFDVLYACAYACGHVYIHIRVYKCIHSIHVYIYVYICIYIYIHTFVCTIYLHLHTCMNHTAHVHTYSTRMFTLHI